MRAPVAFAYAYAIARPLFALGYYKDPKGMGRLPGLFLGGFWCPACHTSCGLAALLPLAELWFT